MKRNRYIILAGMLLAGSWTAFADEQEMTAEQFEASLHYRQGTVELLDGTVRMEVPKSFRYLDPEDSERVLVDGWGNPPGTQTLGMLFPADAGPLSDEGWGIVITYDEDGHISDEDAGDIDYNDLLSNMKEEAAADNEERAQQGYETVDLVGWAKAPYYDSATHKYYWAKELKFGDMDENTLNYNVRILGREGVLVLNAVAGMHQLAQIDTEIKPVLGFTNFSTGNRYEDFDASTDKMAAYGLAALVGGVAAKKLGLIALVAAFFVKFWKILLLGLAAISGFLFKRKKGAEA